MNLAIVGITGMVGREMLDVIEQRNLNITKLIPVASKKSKGKSILFMGVRYKIITLEELLTENVDIALFSAGSEVSRIWAPKLSLKGVKVIDNSSCWRMNDKYKLIVPEVNGSTLSRKDLIISNPNCSTIQLVMGLAPLHRRFNIKRVIVSTYQAVSGTGKRAVNQLKQEENKVKKQIVYPHQIYQNVIPQCDEFIENGYTKEEMKLTNETKKILDSKIDVVATAVRVPLYRGHSESVNVEFERDFKLEEIKHELNNMPGVLVLDTPKKHKYPMPFYSQGKDLVYIGRIRRDFTKKNTLNMWIVADNLRKGAATNTVQIAEHLINNKLIKFLSIKQ